MNKEDAYMLAYIRSGLQSGKYLVLPPSIYTKASELLREEFTDEEWLNIYQSERLTP